MPEIGTGLPEVDKPSGGGQVGSFHIQKTGIASHPATSQIILVFHGRFIMQRGLTFWIAATAILMGTLMHLGCASGGSVVGEPGGSQQKPDGSRYGWW